MTRVKICGITNLNDAMTCVHLGVDALGFVFTPSPRQVLPKTVEEIIRAMGPYVTTVGVFVNQSVESILSIASQCRLDALQLHGEESPEFCRKLRPYKIIKTFRLGELFSLRVPKGYEVDAFLLDSDTPERGGSGRTWPWERLKPHPIKKPFIVSGGLTCANVKRAIQILRPYAVDVSSGVEIRPGFKDPKLLERFVQLAKNA